MALTDMYVELRASIADFQAKFAMAAEEITALERAQQQASVAMTESAAVIGAAMTGEAEKVAVSSTTIAEANSRSAMSLERVGIAAETAATQNKLAMAKMSADTAAMSAKMELAAAKAAASNEAIATSGTKTAEQSAASGKKTAGAFGLATLALVAIAAESVHMAANFETSTTRLVTSAGEIDKNLAMVKQGMLQMAGDVGISAQKLAEGMYTVESAGYHGADALNVLKASAQGAKMEGAELKTVADAVSTALTDYHLPADQAALVTSQLVTAVGQGKTTMEEFSGSLHSVTPMAASLGISLADVTGTLAEMTAHGQSADQSSQNLASTMRSLISPTQQQRAEFAQMGLTATQLSDNIGKRGISGTIEDVSNAIMNHMGPSGKVMLNAFNTSKDAAANMNEALKLMPPTLAEMGRKLEAGTISVAEWKKEVKTLPENQLGMARGFEAMYQQAEGFTNSIKNGSPQAQNYTQALQRMTGTTDGLRTALMVSGENMAGTKDNINKISGAAVEAGGNVQGWHEIQGTFNQKLDQAKAALGALFITIGQQLLPVLTPIIAKFAEFAGWMAKHPALAKALAIGITAIAVALGVATIAFAIMSSTMLASPVFWVIAAIVAAIAALIVIIVLVIRHWGDLVAFFKAGVARLKTEVIDPIMNFFRPLVSWFKTQVIDPIIKGWHDIVDWAKKLWPDLKKIIDPILAGIKIGWKILWAEIQVVLDGFIGGFKASWEPTKAFFAEVWNFFKDTFKAAWDIIVITFKAVVEILGGAIKGLIHVIQGIIDFVVGVFTGDWTRAWNGIKEIFAGIWEGIKGILGGVYHFIVGIFATAGTWLLNAGGDLLRGLWDGISAAGSWLWGMVTGWADSLVNGIKSFFGISSPSTVFRDLGGHLMKGFANGIDAHAHLAVNSAKAMSKEVVGAVSGLSGSLSINGSMSSSASSGYAGVLGGQFSVVAPSSGGGGSNVYVTVQGTVVAERDLQSLMQKLTLQYAYRNASNGLRLGV
jgi:TP901 family phage tail tape measure protein